MSKLQKFFAAGALLASVAVMSPSPAAAGSITSTTVTAILIAGSATTPIATIAFANSTSNSPACATIPQIRMHLDVSTNKGRAILNLVTAAMLAGTRVLVQGTNTCSISGGWQGENIDYVQVQNS